MSDEIVFDNFIITDDKAVASSYASQTWEIKSSQEKAVSGGVNTFYFNTRYYVEKKRPTKNWYYVEKKRSTKSCLQINKNTCIYMNPALIELVNCRKIMLNLEEEEEKTTAYWPFKKGCVV